jgi:four helix bundle protein
MWPVDEKKYARSHRDLIVYQKTRALAREIFETTRSFPREESYSLTDQVRRSSRSIGAQVAEAWAKRLYEKHFISKLTDADGEQFETQHWIETAEDCGYLTPERSLALLDQCREIGRLLGSMINKASLFCKPTTHSLRETQAEYFTNAPSATAILNTEY